ncbi:MAG: 50S ribosomal protein L13 [Candidatus Thalassarchaeaceae archaeon]|nr:50S ribosomal protein L13 [Candidatus Thalassarchaeaceae archaeon]MDP7092251.1 50S ribosomal protein L13 [Candidatus Thalassarchaeaceae archaeon]MDP7257609.1 50S ribosomal protein L13 [Candidatus Thalassarchaeaceae archaeon]MDP7445947.1 50S ribosomal protein L13 [Candidatus Thalassarchaeaceae archaeon]MDP7648921.1 50S ribosomal protein L13 [Candidatus Thalassarchaeaceae archaeon]
MSEATTVYDAKDKVLGRLASQVAKEMISARKSGKQHRVIVINAEGAIVSGPRAKVLSDYRAKYNLNHARKGPFFPRMPDKIIKRTVRGMLPYQKNSSGRGALRDLRVMIGAPPNLSDAKLPDDHEWGDTKNIVRKFPNKFVRLGEISSHLGVDATRWGGE